MRRPLPALGFIVSSALATLALCGVSHAGDPVVLEVTDPVCQIRGVAAIAKGVQLFDAPKGGHLIAVFSGALTPATLSAIPLTDTLALARLSTSVAGTPGFRVDGYVATSQVPLYTTTDLAVVGAQVMISAQQAVRLVGATKTGLRVDHAVLGSANQVVAAQGDCASFALAPNGRPPYDDGTDARGFRMRVTTVDLYDAPGGRVVFTLNMQPGGTQLFWSRQSRGGFTQVSGRSDIVLDGWVRPRVLEAMHPGELMDPMIPATPTGAIIGLNGDDKPMVATKDIPIRAAHEPESPVIGVIEAGAEFYFFANLEGWASVWPKTLAMKPPEGGGFWVPEADVMP